MLRKTLQALFEGKSLSRTEATEVMDLILAGKVSGEQIAAFLGAIRTKGETLDELVGFATSIREHAVSVPPVSDGRLLIDTCGTGGDGAGTFNISTVTAFVVAAAGIGIAKHGNRSVSSRCGSADVLEALGVRIDLAPKDAARAIGEVGFAFLFAPHYHPAFKNVEPVRRALGVRTLFNLLGPLVNPARVKRQVMGVYDRRQLPRVAEILNELGSEEAWVVASDDGLDEVSLSAPTQVIHLKARKTRAFSVTAAEAGLAAADPTALRGGDARENAGIIERILGGEKGPCRDIVLLNASASLLVAGKATTLKDGVALAASLIDQGKAREVLKKSQRFK